MNTTRRAFLLGTVASVAAVATGSVIAPIPRRHGPDEAMAMVFVFDRDKPGKWTWCEVAEAA